MKEKLTITVRPTKNRIKLRLLYLLINLQILRTGNSCHQRFARQTSSAAVTSDLFVVWYPGLCSKCHSIHGSFSGNQADLQKEHIQSVPGVPLKTKKKAFFLKIKTNCYWRDSLLFFINLQGKCVWHEKPTQPKHTRFRNTSQKFDDVRMFFKLLHRFKFFHQFPLVRFSSVSWRVKRKR